MPYLTKTGDADRGRGSRTRMMGKQVWIWRMKLGGTIEAALHMCK